MSDYVRDLRSRIGTAVLEIPTASVIVFDHDRRVLLVRHVEGNDWTTPGGMIEPYERPADAAVRETWEETGLHVSLVRLLGVFGGPLCSGVYANGDKVSWVSTVFEARAVGGTLKPDGVETLEARYFGRDEVSLVRCKPHVSLFLDAAYAAGERARFEPATWSPPHERPADDDVAGAA
jgi:8-oxo-dGTP pyrophosphatase MutT (NUDIX family)